MYYGTTDAESLLCKGLLGTSSLAGPGASTENDPAMLLAKMAYKTFFNWAVATYPESFE